MSVHVHLCFRESAEPVWPSGKNTRLVISGRTLVRLPASAHHLSLHVYIVGYWTLSL